MAHAGEAPQARLREDRRIVRVPEQILAFVLAVSMPGCTEPLPALTNAELHRALSPTTALKVLCYDASRSKRDNRSVSLELELHVNDRGKVRTELIASDTDDPELIECMRRGFNAYTFPAHRKPANLSLRFALVPPRTPALTTTRTLRE